MLYPSDPLIDFYSYSMNSDYEKLAKQISSNLSDFT